MDITGQAALVTGAASGLGAATAAALRAGGAKVALLDLDEKGVMETAGQIGGLGLACDVTDADSMSAAIAAAREVHGAARILVNCAGIVQMEPTIGPDGPIPLDRFNHIVAVNLCGTFNAIRLAAADMLALDPVGDGSRGIIINTASGAAHEGSAGGVAYAASKGGVAAMTLPLAREFSGVGIRVVTISPGPMRTPMLTTLPEETLRTIEAQAPFPKRLGEPAEFAELVVHICRNTFFNGSVIQFDAGARLPYGFGPEVEIP